MMTSLSPDTQATLLLVGQFAKSSDTKPLTVTEYNKLAKQLINLNLRPADMLRQLPKGLVIDSERLTNLLERGTSLALAIERWSQLGIKIVGRGDESYPSKLKKKLRSLAPPILYCVGNLELLQAEAVCVVGSRDASESGLKFAEKLGERCALEGLTVVSGDARGVDRTAMESALKAGGHVAAVLVDALTKVVLAKRNREPIMSGKLILVSPYDPDSSFTVAKAMDRNKYMYALGSAAIVIDSDTKGGTWAGAVENQKYRWTQAFVRLENDAALGNQRLADIGLLPIEGLQRDHPKNFKDFLFSKYEDNAPQLDLPPSEPKQIFPDPKHSEAPLYLVFVEMLEEWLIEGPQSDTAIAKHFGLESVQVEKWLGQAEKTGAVLELQEPKLFAVRRALLHKSG